MTQTLVSLSDQFQEMNPHDSFAKITKKISKNKKMVTKGTTFEELIRNRKRAKFLRETVPGYKKLVRKLIRKQRSVNPSKFSEKILFDKENDNLTESSAETNFSKRDDLSEGISQPSLDQHMLEGEDWLSCSLNDQEESQFTVKSADNGILSESSQIYVPMTQGGSDPHESNSGFNPKKEIIEVEYDPKMKDLYFFVEQFDGFNKKTSSKVIRSELLKSDPLLVLRFYEKNLEVSKGVDLKLSYL